MARTLFDRWSTCWLLLPSLPAFAQQANSESQFDVANPQSTDVVHHGPYQIFACGGHASIVAHALDSLWTDLILAIDYSSSNTTSPAFNAFFKAPTSAPFVTEILTNISHGIPIMTWTSQIPHRPVLVCAFEPGVTIRVHQQTIDMYDGCRGPLTPPTAFAIKSNYWIVLCPQFFTDTIPATPPWQLNPPSAPQDYCRKKDRLTRTFGGLLIRYKPSIVLHELVHQYLVASELGRSHVKETYTFDGALNLSVDESLENPANYQFYVAGKSHCAYLGSRSNNEHRFRGEVLTFIMFTKP